MIMKNRKICLLAYCILMFIPGCLSGQENNTAAGLVKLPNEKDSIVDSAMRRPPIRIKRKNTNDSVRILGALKPLIVARFNSLPQKAVLSTGTRGFCVMNQNIADHIEVKYDTLETNNEKIDEEALIYNAIVDSIEIGNITLYNIPVVIQPDTCLTTPILLGIPLMQLIGKILIDNENKKITFPVEEDDTYSSKEPNLFIYDEFLYTHLTINEKEFTGFFNTGQDEFLAIDTAFYEKYKDDIKLDTVIALPPMTFTTEDHTVDDLSYAVPYNPIIKFEDKIIPVFRKRSVMIHALSPFMSIECFDGFIGYHCLKRFGKKALLDFDNMRLEIKETAN